MADILLLETFHFKESSIDFYSGEVVFGQTCPIVYNKEIVQIGYRLGKLAGHNKVYAIDDDTSLDIEVPRTPAFAEALNTLYTDVRMHDKDSIVDLYKYYNNPRFSTLNHSAYIQANAVNENNNYIGVELTAKWYKRNLKIFSNIQQLAAKSKRSFIIYGAGHLQILKDLINADNNLRLVDVYQYL